MATRTYVKVTVNEVMNLYDEDYNFSQIAKTLGCCRNTVRKKIREYTAENGGNIYISTKPCKNGYEPLILCDMHSSGQSVEQIAKNSGFSRSYIYKVLKEYLKCR